MQMCISFLPIRAQNGINLDVPRAHGRMANGIRSSAQHWEGRDPMAKIVLDLHDIYNRSDQIDAQLNRVVQEALAKRIPMVEIIPGKGSGQLKKRVLRFLNQSHIRSLYHRIEKDDRNFGRIFIHFRH
jgi:dsDNA-specific endonuclease/ATPase MutS2